MSRGRTPRRRSRCRSGKRQEVVKHGSHRDRTGGPSVSRDGHRVPLAKAIQSRRQGAGWSGTPACRRDRVGESPVRRERRRRARTTDGTVHRRDGANTRKRHRDVSRARQDRRVPLRRRDVHRRAPPARPRHTDTARRLRPHRVVREPRLIVVIGANGAGKTTWTRKHREMLPKPFYNADSIAEGLGDANDAALQRAARKLVDERIERDLGVCPFVRRRCIIRHSHTRKTISARSRRSGFDDIRLGRRINRQAR